MKKVLTYKRVYLLGLIPISIILILLARKSSYFAEEIFAKHIYKWISQVLSSITGIVPFSLAEVVTVAFPIIMLVLFVRFILRLLMEKNNRKKTFGNGVLNLFCLLSVLLFTFTMFGGLNYYRYPFSEYSNLEIQEASIQELYGLTKSMALQANELRAQVPETDENGVFKLSMSDYELAKIADQAYDLIAEDYPILGGHYGAPKPILLSKWMSKTEISGEFFPFTMEANVNVDIPDYTIPATMLHELAHLRGFMREDEANFLSYLVGIKSDSVEVRYSSTMLALINAGNALYEQNPDLYFEIRDLYSEDVIKDIRANATYWKQFEDTVISTMSNKINDTYLKVNNQTDGVKSYGRMLDLMLALYRKNMEEN